MQGINTVLHGLQQRPACLGRVPTHPARSRVVSAALKRGRTSNRTPTHDGSPQTKNERAKAKDECIARVNAKYGARTLIQLGSEPMRVEKISTGCLTLDRAVGGGYPKGRVIEIFGQESSGKTTLALHAVLEVQKAGGNAAFIDAEHAFDQSYAEALGIDCTQLTFAQPEHGEMAFNILDDLVRSGSFDLVVVDSVSALTPKAEIEVDIGTPVVGAQARLMSHALRKVSANASKSGCTIIFINQMRFKIGVLFGNPETTSGGQALKFYSSIRLKIANAGKVEGKEGQIGNKAKVTVVKNKVADPYDTAEFDVLFGQGINTVGCVLDVATEDLGIVTKKGAYYYWDEVRLGQGRDKALQYLRENPEQLGKLEAMCRERLQAQGATRDLRAASRASLSQEEEEDEDVFDLDADLDLPDDFGVPDALEPLAVGR